MSSTGHESASAVTDLIAVMNAGSSSLKFALYDGETPMLRGEVDGIGVHPRVEVEDAKGNPLEPFPLGPHPPASTDQVVPPLISWLHDRIGSRKLAGVGHRVLHGGLKYERPVIVTPAVLQDLEKLIPLAPLHQPHNLGPIRTALAHQPDLPQVACFDTSFHRTIPEVGQAFALPYEMFEEGIRRYGFHGLSYEFIASRLRDVSSHLAEGRVIVMHLGNGVSACALRAGVSQATTMSFTALDGLPMGTRCGQLDPAVLLYLLMQRGMEPAAIEDLLYKRSGVLGLSGISLDFRDLLASRDPRAAFALDVFAYRVSRYIGSLTAALGGVDGLVFTAGIGEHAAPVRAAICRYSAWLGVELDEAANRASSRRISTPGSRVEVLVIPTNEELMIARHTARLVLEAAKSGSR